MSALADIAFGQNTSDEEWNAVKDKWPYNTSAPRPIDDNINLDPALKEIKEHRFPSSSKTMNNILKQAEKTVTAITTVNSPSSTDDIASLYEEKISRSISSKIMASTKEGIPPVFTVEENAYLQKKSIEANASPEVEVITEDPPITLKKGNTEINIKNAASLVKRMDRVYSPTSQNGGTIPKDVPKEMLEKTSTHKWEDQKTEEKTNSNSQRQYGKNAYEIRSDVLKMAIDWSMGEHVCQRYLYEDELLNLAKKFYAFVENKR